MMKISALIVVAVSLVSLTAQADVSVNFKNEDGTSVTCLKVTSSPSPEPVKIKFEGKTGTVTIPGDAPVRIACPISKNGSSTTLNGGETITFRLGKIGFVTR